MLTTEVRRPLLADAVLSRLMDNLTGGPFLAGLAVFIGATNLQIALLAALPFMAQVLQLPAVALLLRFQDRRRIVAWTAGGARLLWVVVGLMVAFGLLSTAWLVWVVAASSALAVVATAAWNWWMRDLLPPEDLGAFFGQRLRGASLATMAVILCAAYGLDRVLDSGHPEYGYGALFVGGGLLGLGSVVALLRTPHVAPPPSPPARQAAQRIVSATRHASKRLLTSLSLAGMGVSFALPFVAVYILRSLGYSLFVATAMAALSQLAYVAGLRGWAHVSDRHGDRPLAMIALGVLAASLAGWSLAGWERGASLLAMLALLHFVSGYALSGIELSTTNLMLRSAPASNAAAHLAALSVVRAGAAGAGILVSGWLWDSLGRGVLWTTQFGAAGTWELRGFQVLCMLSILPCMWAIFALARLRQPANPRLVEVARAMRREVHQMSSIAGMRAFIHAVSYSVEFFAAPFASRLRGDEQDESP